ncbi:phosphatidylserine lipase ABHD16A [Scaptodrosophila lebanonensis]|uniref:Phosphatidylserine lipase ABHD16A n=1 Tax=Drosophila lebanonensis TaxID=7225 RepID=A0A6J2TGR8_DROLE|nr:phosphatidylserine lipase ABHD16A [Scaptodrosophila lebanonensis]
MSILNYIFGPKLYMEYKGVPEPQRKMYEPGAAEKFGDQILSTLSVMWNISYYTSPLIITFLYRRGYFVAESMPTLAKITTSVGLIVMISLFMRGIGRLQSRAYSSMMKALEQAKANKTCGDADLRRFDFEFSAWPVDFDVGSTDDDKKKSLNVNSRRSGSLKIATLPCELAAYLAISTFGLSMMYPGSVKLLQKFMRPMLISGRAKLIEDDNGLRYKIKTIDSNEIDTVFVDNRNDNIGNGKTLVICSEGNAGFYEIGIMATPIALKYSVLGWNHPGFEGSTGKPYPEQDRNAIDAVVQFAIQQLGFAVEDIILYGWSIGGFSTLVAASNYAGVKGVILDATFDDVLYLAETRMPTSLSGIVKIAIRNYCNLNNSELAMKYHGPILLIRRTEDEIIAEDNRIETNRGNFLTLSVLKYRYPNIFRAAQIGKATNMLSKPLEVSNFTVAEEKLCMSRLITYASDQGKSFPMLIGEDYSEEVLNQMAMFLLRKHLRDFSSTHCSQLPGEFFSIPWDIPTEHGFVFT